MTPRKPRSEDLILEELWKCPRRWTDLLKSTGYPRSTLANALERMRNKGTIETVLFKNRVHWQLTAKGKALVTGVD